MNHQNNYLRYISQSDSLSKIQQFIKKYSKGLSLLVKVNKDHINKSDALSPWIVWFLFRMQLTQCVKQYLIHWATKKEKLGLDKIPDMFIHWFYRVSFPTLVLYIWILIFKNYFCPHLDKLMTIPALNLIDCDWCVSCFEMIYIFYFIYVEFRAKA
jgi:hypothetical protein